MMHASLVVSVLAKPWRPRGVVLLVLTMIVVGGAEVPQIVRNTCGMTVDAQTGQVSLAGSGVVTIACPPGVTITVVEGSAAPVSGAEQVRLWVQDDQMRGCAAAVSSNAPMAVTAVLEPAVQVHLVIEKPGKSPSFVLRGLELGLGDGRRVRLADLPVASKRQPAPMPTAIDPVTLDWLRQRWDIPWSEACVDELRRIGRILARADAATRQAWADRLRAWEQPVAASQARERYLALRAAKRELLLGGLDFQGILCIDTPMVSGSEANHEVRYRNEDTAAHGGRLVVVDGFGPQAPVRVLAPSQGRAAFWRPDLSFDASRIAFCMKPEGEPAYHLYEIGLDGVGLRQITHGGYNDLDPLWLPDGGLAFNTTRANQHLRCGGSKFRMPVLARCERDGTRIRFLSANVEADYSPSLLEDGRILFTRWEYVDKEILRVQSLWTINPDGTALSAVWGNQSKWPDMIAYARPMSSDGALLINAVGHHNVYWGALALIRPSEGLNYPDGLYQLTPHLAWPEVGAGPADRPLRSDTVAPTCHAAFLTPFPLDAERFLVSASIGRFVGDPLSGRFGVYLMDLDGNMELLWQGEQHALHAMPVRARSRPPVVAPQTRWPGPMTRADQQPQSGIFYSGDIYEGSGIPAGTARRLRVLEIEPQTFGDGDRSSKEEAKLLLPQRRIPHLLSGETAMSLVYDEGPKRILGTVPIESDGSVHLEVPPLRALYFQVLDERGRCLQTMRSSVHAMPGEVRGCVGCHETRPHAPRPSLGLAMKRPPSRIEPPSWGDETVSFPRLVQPILDRHCVSCHGGGTQPSGGIDLTHRTPPGTLMSTSYAILVYGRSEGRPTSDGSASFAGPLFPYVQYPSPGVRFPTLDTVVPPMSALSFRSRLVAMLADGTHHGVQVSLDELARVIAWVDANCPYLGLEEILAQPDPDPMRYSFKGFSYRPRMRTAPYVHRAFDQDAFTCQDDRIPKGADGEDQPSIVVTGGRRVYRLPDR